MQGVKPFKCLELVILVFSSFGLNSAFLRYFLAPFGTKCYCCSHMATSTRQKNVLRNQWPRVLWMRKRGRLQLCVDSRKTGFPTGKREFFDTPAEALAV